MGEGRGICKLKGKIFLCHPRMLLRDFRGGPAVVRSSHSLSSSSDVDVFLEGDGSCRTIDSDALASYDVRCSTGYTHNCRDAILAGDDGSVGYHAAHFHHQATSSQEEGGPAGVGRRCNQDFARLQSCPCWIKDDTRQGCNSPW